MGAPFLAVAFFVRFLLCAMGPKRIERRAVLVEDVEYAITVNVKQRLVSFVPGHAGSRKEHVGLGLARTSTMRRSQRKSRRLLSLR